MTIPAEKEITTAAGAAVAHPLDPLTSEEIVRAASILRDQRQLGPRVRFETIVLKEPEKELVRNFSPGDTIRREVFLAVLDNETEATYEATVSLEEEKVTSWRHVPGVQPRIMYEEFVECEATVQSSPEFRAALEKRGITDPDLIMVDSWSAGYYGFPDEEGRRLVIARCFLRTGPNDNGLRPPRRGTQRRDRPEQDGGAAD